MYIYENHMGGVYVSDEPRDDEDLYCDQCGDRDWLIGYADTKEHACELLRGETNVNGSGGWYYDYIQEFITQNWE